jgi:hypothetical protein
MNGRPASMLKNGEISSSAPGQRVMTLRELRVDRLFPNHVTTCWVRNSPPRSKGLGHLFKHLNVS